MATVVLVEVRVGELGENLSKLPLGRASGALLESQLERSIAGYRVHPAPTRLPSHSHNLWGLTTCDRRCHLRQLLQHMTQCHVEQNLC